MGRGGSQVADVLRRAAVLLREGPSADIASLPAMLEVLPPTVTRF